MSASIESVSLLGTVCRYLDQDDWNYRLAEGRPGIWTGVTGQNASFRIFIVADDQKSVVLIYSHVDARVPEDRRVAVAEFLTRANWGHVLGNFEMDFADGEVRYRTAIDIEGGALAERMFRNLLAANVQTADRYYPGFMRVMYGEMTPAEAIDRIERPQGTH